jgi:hypothetical protein
MHPNKHMDGAHHPHLIYFNLLKISVLTHNLDPTTRFFTKVTSNAQSRKQQNEEEEEEEEERESIL